MMADDFTYAGQANGQQTTSFAQRCAALSQIEGYWQAVRGGRMMPNRADISPRGIEDALSFAFILERTGPGVVRFRLAGSDLSELMGMDLRSMPITALFSSDIRQAASDVFDAVFETPARLSMSIGSRGGLGRAQLRARLLMLPLRSDLGDVTRAVGGIAVDGQLGERPRRFDGLDDVRLDDLAHAKPGAIMELAEPPAVYHHKEKTLHRSERSYLKVVK